MSTESRTGRMAGVAALSIGMLMLGGCALAMLNGAAQSGSPAPASSSASAADGAISTAVRSKIAANTALKGLNFSVDTHDGVVTLGGQVAKVDQRNAAELAARSVRGVKAVQNRVTVR